MGISAEFRSYLDDQFEFFGPIVIRPMFGGAGIFRDGLMFGLVASECLYLKADDGNREDYERQGLRPFTYQGKSRQVSLGYYEVSADVLEDPQELKVWADKAFAAALASARKKRPAKRRRKRQP